MPPSKENIAGPTILSRFHSHLLRRRAFCPDWSLVFLFCYISHHFFLEETRHVGSESSRSKGTKTDHTHVTGLPPPAHNLFVDYFLQFLVLFCSVCIIGHYFSLPPLRCCLLQESFILCTCLRGSRPFPFQFFSIGSPFLTTILFLPSPLPLSVCSRLHSDSADATCTQTHTHTIQTHPTHALTDTITFIVPHRLATQL